MSFGRFTSQLLRSLPAQAFSVSLAGMALWASCPSPVVAAGAPLEAVVTQVVRRVDWQRALTTRWQPAGLDLVLLTGDSLRTGQDAKAELLYGDGSVTRVGALTRLTIAGDQKRELRLEAGRIWLQIRKSGAGMRIHTPGAVATVTGTELVVEFDPTRRATEVTVFEGAVDVAGDVGQLVRVLAGTTTRVPIQAPAAAPVPIDDRKLQERNVLFKPLSLNEAPGSPAPAAPEAAPPTDPAAGTRPNRADASVPGPAPGNATQETPPGEPKPAPGAVKPDMKGQTDKLLDPRVINGSPTTGSVRVIIE